MFLLGKREMNILFFILVPFSLLAGVGEATDIDEEDQVDRILQETPENLVPGETYAKHYDSGIIQSATFDEKDEEDASDPRLCRADEDGKCVVHEPKTTPQPKVKNQPEMVTQPVLVTQPKFIVPVNMIDEPIPGQEEEIIMSGIEPQGGEGIDFGKAILIAPMEGSWPLPDQPPPIPLVDVPIVETFCGRVFPPKPGCVFDKVTELPPDNWLLDGPKHMNHEDLVTYLRTLHTCYQLSTKLYSIGTSVRNRTIPCLVLCNNNMECRERPLLKPKFRYTANIHGDEATGRGLVTYLAQFLLTEKDKNPRVAELLRTVEIHIVPTLNPDGFEDAYEQYATGIGGKNVSKGRRNANDKDLNRDFPHIFNFSSTSDPLFWKDRQPETIAYMNQSITELYVMDGNMHTGDLVISIPLDYHRPNLGPMKATNYEARPPDFDLFRHAALTYSFLHPDMHREDHFCHDTMSNFTHGVVNGAEWYEVKGSAGDFVYKFANALELTIEMSCIKFVEEVTFPQEWEKNRDALMAFMELSNIGVKGLVRYCDSKLPAPFATVEVRHRRHPMHANERGEYFRPLLDGRYEIRARAGKGAKPSQWIPVDIFNINGPKTLVIDVPPLSEDHRTTNRD